ncbi:DUF4362 domain-containing protein [Paenibacillus segetis]|uniref:DUF4362 domain-containing protein n=1 Tax=Paenibacillus segetis TaxID=1325360 RepID=A0ABQ1YEV4_9BACL|nr:DUF4362 domain-containing protein [Paenibacillus segetis]GGH23624.1 hypothetical protein GCM10008013_22870 [Paenibacillus segetis]
MKLLYPFLLFALFLTGCNSYNSYSSEEAKKNGDIITGPPGEINFEKIDKFIEDIKKDVESKIRITSYTEEGDPILNDLIYKNGIIEYTYDSSRDKYGGKDKGKYKTQCKKIETREITGMSERDRTEYILIGCNEIIGIHDSDKDEIYILNKWK